MSAWPSAARRRTSAPPASPSWSCAKTCSGHALPICPSAFDYKTVADNDSMYNTPPTYAIYIAGLIFQWLKRQREGGADRLAAMEQRNIAKAALLYDSSTARSST